MRGVTGAVRPDKGKIGKFCDGGGAVFWRDVNVASWTDIF